MNSTEMRKTPDFPESYKSTILNKSNILLYIEIFLRSFKLIYAKYSKVNSEQEACAKCLAIHILKFEILQLR